MTDYRQLSPKIWCLGKAQLTVACLKHTRKLLDGIFMRKEARPQPRSFVCGLLCMPIEVDGIIQVVLTSQSICSPQNGHNLLQNRIATWFHLPWVFSATVNQGVQGGETRRATAPWSGAESPSDARKLWEVQWLVASSSWDSPAKYPDYLS